jgi:hypothetical protein
MMPIVPLASLLIGLQLFLGGLPRGFGPGSELPWPMDSGGSAVWARKFSNVYWPNLHHGIPLAGGGCLAVGDVGPLFVTDGWIVQVGAAGTIDKQWGYALQKSGQLQAIAPTADGGYISAGRTDFDSDNLGGYGWLMKLDKDLVPKWNKTYAMGKAQNDFLQVACLSDGGFLLAGRSFGADGYSSLIVKTNSTGGVVWVREIPGSIFCAMIPTPDKGLLALVTVNGESDWLPTLIKLDSTGKVKWAKQSDGPYTFRSGFVTSSGDFIIGGASGSQNLVMKVSGGGAVKWQSAFGSTFSYMSKIFPAPGGGAYFVTPNSTNPTPQVVIAKVTGTGGLSFARGYAPFTSCFQESADHAFKATDGSIVMLCDYLASTAIVRFDANGRTDPKCTPFPIKYKRTNPKLALKAISITPKKVKLTVKTVKVTRKATAALLEAACK